MFKTANPTLNNLSMHTKVKDIAYTLWGVFLLFLSAQISIPLEPVPITLQTFGVMLIGLTFDRKTAIQAIATYLALGALGVPVLANFSAGYQKFLGSTAGYLFGFLAAVACMTSLRKHLQDKNLFHISLNCLMGTLIIFICGIGWLSQLIGLGPAIKGGFLPFIVPGMIKIALLAVSVRYLQFGRLR